jgi:hypothetical protein
LGDSLNLLKSKRTGPDNSLNFFLIKTSQKASKFSN